MKKEVSTPARTVAHFDADKYETRARRTSRSVPASTERVFRRSNLFRQGSDGVANVKAAVAIGSDGVVEGIDGVAKGIDGVAKAIDGVSKGTDGIAKGIDGVGRGIDGVEKGTDGVAEGIDWVGRGVAAVADRIAPWGERF